MYGLNRRAVNMYNDVGVRSGVEGANGHRLVQMLMQGALDRIAVAKGAIVNKNIESKGKSISSALAIIDTLRASLNLEKGGDIASNLYELYSYMERRLLEANIKSDLSMLEEVGGLLMQIKSGWDGIQGKG